MGTLYQSLEKLQLGFLIIQAGFNCILLDHSQVKLDQDKDYSRVQCCTVGFLLSCFHNWYSELFFDHSSKCYNTPVVNGLNPRATSKTRLRIIQ